MYTKMADADKPLNIRLKLYLAEKGYKIKTVAKNSNIKPNTLYRILSGSQKCTVDELQRISRAIGVNAAEFFKN